MKVVFTMVVNDDYADIEHETGVTTLAHDEMQDALSFYGSDIQIHREGG